MPADDPAPATDGQAVEEDEELAGAPWHFKLLLVAFVIYLLYRGVQLIDWGIRALF